MARGDGPPGRKQQQQAAAATRSTPSRATAAARVSGVVSAWTMCVHTRRSDAQSTSKAALQPTRQTAPEPTPPPPLPTRMRRQCTPQQQHRPVNARPDFNALPCSPMPPPPLYDPIPRGGSHRRRTSSDSRRKVKVLNSIREEIIDKSSDEYQRTSWIILQRSIYYLLNKINSECDVWKINGKLLQLNIIRGRGIFCRLIMDNTLYSTQNTAYFAALVALINVHFPIVGELLLTRLICQFKSAFQQNDKSQCLSSVTFISHLVNQNVADSNLAFEIVRFLFKSPSENSLEIVSKVWSACGYKMNKTNKKKMNTIIDMMKTMSRDKRLADNVKSMIKVSIKMIRNNKVTYQPFTAVVNSNKHTHAFVLNDVFNTQHYLDYYLFDPEYESNEYIYKLFCKQILEIENEEYVLIYDTDDMKVNNNKGILLQEKLNNNLIILKRALDLIVGYSYSYDKSALKLIDCKLIPGQELEICFILLNYCCQHKIYNESLGHATQILCQLNRSLVEPLEDVFIDTYAFINNFDKIKIRNVAKFFAHLLFTDTISWMVLSTIQLNETDTTHSSRMYIKILFQELVEHMGLDMLNYRVQDTLLKEAFEGIFLDDNQDNPKFAINFFESIGLDSLIDTFRSSIVFKLKRVYPKGEVDKF